MAFPTRLLEPEGALPEVQVDLLPFHIAYDGPAPISTYFMRRPCPPELAQGPGELISAFRGRELHGTPISIPAGYEGRVVSVSAPKVTEAKSTLSKSATLPRKRVPVAPAPSAGTAKKRRTSPRKAKMAFSLDSPESSPIKAEGDSLIEEMTTTTTTYAPQEELVVTEQVIPIAEAVETEMLTEQDVSPAAMPEDAQAAIHLKPVGTFDHFMLWSPDGVPVDKGADPYVRTLEEWIALSQLVRHFGHPFLRSMNNCGTDTLLLDITAFMNAWTDIDIDWIESAFCTL